ncbi:DUF2946 family protein [Roseibium algae]|uniref:DUF2946 family protein n=1 Tax=Roseibium algae TaxID=3123038 RepID=A0ABU8TIE2_9HYPH
MLAWILLVPFLAFGGLANGTMLSRDNGGEVGIVICTGGGSFRVVLDANGAAQPVSDQDDEHDGVHCDWSLHAKPYLASYEIVAIDPALIALVTLVWTSIPSDHALVPRRFFVRGPPKDD